MSAPSASRQPRPSDKLNPKTIDPVSVTGCTAQVLSYLLRKYLLNVDICMFMYWYKYI